MIGAMRSSTGRAESRPLARRVGPREEALLTVALLGLSLVGAAVVFWPGLDDMIAAWSRDEYSHGYVVPLIGAFLLAQRLPRAAQAGGGGRVFGVAMVLFGVLTGLVGQLSQINDLTQYGFLSTLTGLVVASFGVRMALMLWAPLLYLAFMVPLPQVVYLKLSAGMQLLSSELGVQLIRALRIPVYLEGNVIDLGAYKLQIAEACSGLRYLFPLLSFGFLFAMIYRGPSWHKSILFLSTTPITILMNSLRIGIIGVLVNRYGIEQAEGFLHFFEGWVIFVVCVLLLFGEALVLMQLTGLRRPLGEVLDLRLPQIRDLRRAFRARARAGPVLATTIILLAAFAVVQTVGVRSSAPAGRQEFAVFPAQLGAWRGRTIALDPVTLQVLAADDTLLSNYREAEQASHVNLFMAYYDAQTDGRAIHSPEVCIPGDGWEIAKFQRIEMNPENAASQGLQVNRAVIQKGLERQLVYYWFAGRGRQLANEYFVKWYILWDGLTRGRTDGALVRLVTPIRGADGEALAEERLRAFIEAMAKQLPRFIPS